MMLIFNMKNYEKKLWKKIILVANLQIHYRLYKIIITKLYSVLSY